jgi:hypothetical protein
MSLTRLHKKAWDLQSIAIRKEEDGQCFTCTKKDDPKNMQAGHFKHGKHMDFFRENIHCQCRRCNHSLSGNGTVYAEKLEALYGFGIIQKLSKLKDGNHIWKRSELEEIIKRYAN